VVGALRSGSGGGDGPPRRRLGGQAERACRTALAEHGPIDILINNVGGRRVDIPTQDMPVERWHTLIDLNLTSTFVCTKLLGGAMIVRGRGRPDHQHRFGLRPDREPGDRRAELRDREGGGDRLHARSRPTGRRTGSR
jgi:NAD(P)-dependent dehydrogenase (short-subunit alcohol dehydrogenase family)